MSGGGTGEPAVGRATIEVRRPRSVQHRFATYTVVLDGSAVDQIGPGGTSRFEVTAGSCTIELAGALARGDPGVDRSWRSWPVQLDLAPGEVGLLHAHPGPATAQLVQPGHPSVVEGPTGTEQDALTLTLQGIYRSPEQVPPPPGRWPPVRVVQVGALLVLVGGLVLSLVVTRGELHLLGQVAAPLAAITLVAATFRQARVP